MTQKEQFTEADFRIVEAHCDTTENKLVTFLKENYPHVIRDGEINLIELKAAAGLQIDEKINGYGLNFIGRNVARAKYKQKTAKVLNINRAFSKNFDTTQNMILKGDNIDCMKILKSYYNGSIKCIYIDPPYNTDSDEFVYPDKFNKEEQEILELTNISENDFKRMEFCFRTPKSHNGWLSFMYPRLMLAHDLLSKDGVIFISIDDNEQANLKLLCDEIFGEENFISILTVIVKTEGRRYGAFAKTHENILVYSKNRELFETISKEIEVDGKKFSYSDELGGFNLQELRNQNTRAFNASNRPNLRYPFYVDLSTADENGFCKVSVDRNDSFEEINAIEVNGLKSVWRWGKEKSKENEKTGLIARKGTDGIIRVYQKYRKLTETPKTVWFDKKYISNKGTKEVQELIGIGIFDFPKPVELIKTCLSISTSEDDLILDFFAGSGTTAHAVMQLNAEDGGNRKFILCQIDEPIKKNKTAYKFCAERGLPPVISSITCERVKFAGEKIIQEIVAKNAKSGMFEENKQELPDVGFKVFDLIDTPKLEEENGTLNLVINNNNNDSLSRIYNMIFSVGVDSPTDALECIVANCMYKTGNNYYITNSDELKNDKDILIFADAIKNGNKVFIDGWTTTPTSALQNYNEAVKIVF